MTARYLLGESAEILGLTSGRINWADVSASRAK